MAEEKQKIEEKEQEVEQGSHQLQIQVSNEEPEDDSGPKKEEKKARCVGMGLRAHELKGEWSKFWLHGDMQHLHSGGTLSPETTSLLHIFLDFFPSLVPHKLSKIIAY